MKNSVKIGLGILAGGGLLLAARIFQRNKNKVKTFTAPDGHSYKENEMYRNAHGDIYRNGRKVRMETPGEPGLDHHYTDAHHNTKSMMESGNQTVRNTNYHHKGLRHH